MKPPSLLGYLLGYRLVDNIVRAIGIERTELLMYGILADHHSELNRNLFEHGFSQLGELIESGEENISGVFAYMALTSGLPLLLTKIGRDDMNRIEGKAIEVNNLLYNQYEKMPSAMTHASVFLRFSLLRVIHILKELSLGSTTHDDIKRMNVYDAFVLGSFLKAFTICDIYGKVNRAVGNDVLCSPSDIAILFSTAVAEPLAEPDPAMVKIRNVKVGEVLKLYIVNVG